MIDSEYRQFLVEQILAYLPSSFHKSGNKYNGRCFLCGDSHKSASKKRGWFYPQTCSYYCFNCGQSLPGLKLLEVLSGESYKDIRKKYVKLFLKSGLNSSLSTDFSLGNSEPTVFGIQPILDPAWKKPLSEKARLYLDQRKVLNAPFFDGNVFSTYTKSGDEYILIPWQVNGVDAYYQLNDFQKLHSLKYIFPKNKKKLVAGLDNIDMSFPYIICFEGFYDSLFVKNGVCVGTKAITDYQVKIIKDRYPHHQICISFDNDTSGLQSMANVIKQDKDFLYFKWFDSHTKSKDINDLVLATDKVNMFEKADEVKAKIVDKLMMKMYLIRHKLWTTESQYKKAYCKNTTIDNHDLGPFWKTRKI